MSRVFLDTSAAYALLVASDLNHLRAAATFRRLQAQAAVLATTSYVLVETYALLGRRVGLEAVKAFRDDFRPLLDVTWVGQELHDRGVHLLVARADASLSVVDSVSFVLMRDENLGEAFAYDRHFDDEGFTVID